MMQRIRFMYKQFLREPLWFKALVIITLLISFIFSSSSFTEQPYYQSISKLAAAIFFLAYGMKFRRNRMMFVLFCIGALLCLYLSWHRFEIAYFGAG
ncbi:hypothetical protein [Paenibacillus sp. N3.4]|uniref:hypothetical protein n=1 Tax=Paenibacillus sp. N3.4 TaxID=2603222 RepID=UPI0011C8B3F8|nr:hypothetical protein [Paenibacillus sp. N3.4]TXK80935.1 hypothetical protein FU659_17445 [Paenibacillus sp. N3.4]